MQEKRREPRWNLNLQLSVFDQYFLEHLEQIESSCSKNVRLVCNAPVGQVSDISTIGLRLSSSTPVSKGAIISLILHAPVPGGGNDTITLNAKCVWCKSGKLANTYDNGFELINPESKAVDRIRQLIYFYKSNVST